MQLAVASGSVTHFVILLDHVISGWAGHLTIKEIRNVASQAILPYNCLSLGIKASYGFPLIPYTYDGRQSIQNMAHAKLRAHS